MHINETRLDTGGREFERTVACAWCGSDNVGPGFLGMPDGTREHVEVVYRCGQCDRATALIIPAAGGTVYVVRYARLGDAWVRAERVVELPPAPKLMPGESR